MHCVVVEPAVGDQAPEEAAAAELAADVEDVGTEKGLPSRKDDTKVLGAVLDRYGVDGCKEVSEGHILLALGDTAVAAAVAAVEIAAGGAFPEEVVELVDLDFVVAEEPEKERIHWGLGFCFCKYNSLE